MEKKEFEAEKIGTNMYRSCRHSQTLKLAALIETRDGFTRLSPRRGGFKGEGELQSVSERKEERKHVSACLD